ncbi:unnamed protein product [Paramecium pentaurelia]|uniref:NACHT domain-containing protein n=1 Tax=Paramecium pentaurelia TaxID=43138 RepID=A0A8S1VDC0_9CILI|nr:unnamed protein product [Paramecium pentaurelia]
MIINQDYHSLVYNEQRHLRGGGSSFSCSDSKKKMNNIYTLIKELNQLEQKIGEPKYQLCQQIKLCLDLIVKIYKDWIQKEINLSNIMNYNSFNKLIEKINEILKVQDNRPGKCCLNYYLELINISLENLQKNISQTKSISIIGLFIQIEKQKNNNESISNLIDAANSLLIGVKCRYFTQFQKFETYFFFILLNQMIKDQVKKGVSIDVNNYFLKIQDQYIKNSTNWTLHNCWIEFLVDLLRFCKNFKKEQKTKQQGAVDIITYITNQDGRNLFDIYLQDFEYEELQQNKWISIDKPELHRLNRIVNFLTGKVNLIETQFQKLNESYDIEQVKQMFQELYYPLLAFQIYLIEMLQLFQMIQRKYEQNIKIKDNFDKINFIISNIKEQIKSTLDTKITIKFWFKLQMIKNNNYDKDRFLQKKSTLKFQNQIQQLIKLVQVLQNFIIQERMLFTNQIILLNDSLSQFNYGFESQDFDSIQRKYPVIDTYEDLCYQINFHLLWFSHIKKIQKIYYSKQQQETLENIIKNLKFLKQELSKKMQEFSQLEQRFFNLTEHIKKCIDKDQQNNENEHEQELPYSYQLFYQEIELIIDQKNQDKYKIEESIYYHFQTIQNNPGNQKLILSCLQQIQVFLTNKIKQLKKKNYINDIQSIESQMQILITSIRNYTTNKSKQEIQDFTDAWKQIESIFQSTQSQISNESSIEKQNLDANQILSILKRCKIDVALRTKQHDSNNHKVLLKQSQQQLNQADQGVSEKKLDDVIKQFICKENLNVVLIISGQIGCGKTKSLKKLNIQLQEIQRDDPNSQNWIPIYLNLSDIKEPQNQLLRKAIQKYSIQLNIKDVNKFYSEILQSKYKVVLLLDGYDQLIEQNNIILQNGLDKRIKNLYNEVTLKIIMTIRNDIIPSERFKETKNIQFTKIQLFDSVQQQEYIKQSYKRLITISLSQVQTFRGVQIQLIVEYVNQLFVNIPQLFYVMPQQVEDDIIYKLIGKIKNGIEFFQIIQNEMKKMRYFLENILIPYLKDILITPQLLKMAIKKWQQKIWLDFEKNDNKIIEVELKKEFTKLMKQVQQGIQEENVYRELKNNKFFKEYHIYDEIPYLENNYTINLNGKHFESSNADLIIQAINAQRFSRYTTLEQFLGFCQKDKVQINLIDDLKIFSQKLSIFLKINNLDALNQQQQNNSQLIINDLEEIFNLQSPYRKAIRESKLITYKNEEITFLNQWILDFFFAQKIILLLKNKQDQETIQFLNDVNLSEKNYEGVVQLLIEQLIKIKNIKTFLIQIIKKSINQTINIRAPSNGIFLLSKMGISLEGEDFQQIIIENTSTQMNNVLIDYCNLNSSKLSNAQSDNFLCIEFPQINADQEILQVIIYKENQQLALLQKKGIIKIVNIEKQVEQQEDIRNPFVKYKQIAISKDDTKLFALANYQIDLWNLTQYYLASYINVEGESIYFYLSPDNTQIICSLYNQYIKVFPLVDYIFKQPKTLQINQDAEQMAINQKNQLLVFRTKQKQIYFFNLQTSQEIKINQQIEANLLTTTNDGRSLIILYGDVIIFYQFEITNKDLVKQKEFLIQNTIYPIGLFVSENPLIILIQNQNMIQIFDTNKNKLQNVQKMFQEKKLILSGDGKMLINWNNNKVFFWDLIDYIKSCQYSPDGNHLLIQSSEKFTFLNIQAKEFKCIHEKITSLCFNPINNMLVTFSIQGLKFWSTNQMQLLYHFDEFEYFEKQQLIFSQNGEQLVIINKGIVICINIKKIFEKNQDQECQKTIKIKKSNNKKIIVKSPNENIYAIQYESLIQIFDYQSSNIITQISLGQSKIFSLSFSQNGQFLAARSSDQKIRIWSTINFCLVCQFNDQFNDQIENHCLWLSDQQISYIVTNYQNSVILYNISQYLEISSNPSNSFLQNSESIQTSIEKLELKQENIPQGLMCRNIVISNDNQYIAISYAKQQEDKKQKVPIIIKKINALQSFHYKIKNQGGFLLAFCPNSQYLATDSYKNNQSYIIIWDIKQSQVYQPFIINTKQSYILNSIEFSPKESYILISDEFNHFSLHNHKIPALNQSQINHQYQQHYELQNELIQNTYCIISINGEYLIYIQNDKLKFEKIKTRLNNIKLIHNYQYNEKDKFIFINNLISYCHDLNQIIQFDLEKCSFTKMIYNSQNQASTFSSTGQYFAFVNETNQQVNLSVLDVYQQKTFPHYVQHPIQVIQFSNNEEYLATLYNNETIIYLIKKQQNQFILYKYQVIYMNSKLLSIQFNPKNDHQFIVVLRNGEILFYSQQLDQQKKIKKYNPMLDNQVEQQYQEANINQFTFTVRIDYQNLLKQFSKKGSCYITEEI